MFFNRKKIEFNIEDENYIIYSLYDDNLKKFYSLVLFKSSKQFLNSLCFTYDKSRDNELLKINKNNLVMFEIGSFNAVNGRIESNVKFMGRFRDLIEDYETKKIKGGCEDGSKSEKD